MTSHATRILSMWHAAEMLEMKQAPKTGRQGHSITQYLDSEPWASPRYAPDTKSKYPMTWQHVIHLGIINSGPVSAYIEQHYGQDEGGAGEKNSPRDIALACIVLNERGQIMDKGVTISSLLYALGRIEAGRGLDGFEDWHREEESKIQGLAARLVEEHRESGLTNANVRGLFTVLSQDTGTEDLLQRLLAGKPPGFLVESRKVSARNADPIDSMLNSFYLGDLARLRDQASKGVTLGAPLEAILAGKEPQDRHDLQAALKDNPHLLNHLLHPGVIPFGRWPVGPDKPLVLAQQLAANRFCEPSRRRLSWSEGVNGPPGTGKTTLLREIFADVVVERGLRIAGLDQPGDVFEGGAISAGRGQYHPLRASIMDGTSMVVTSNNNAAVANIAKEIPAIDALDEPYRNHASYFRELATSFYGFESWGLMTAPLGRSELRSQFRNLFFRDQDNEGASRPRIPSILDAASDQTSSHLLRWKKSAARLRDLKEEHDQLKKQLEQAANRLQEIPALEDEAERLRIYGLELETQRRLIGQKCDDRHAHLARYERKQADLKDSVQLTHLDKPGWWIMWIPWSRQRAAWQEQLARLERELIELRRAMRETNNQIHVGQQSLRSLDEDIEQEGQRLAGIIHRISTVPSDMDALRAKFEGLQIPDAEFWHRSIESKHKSAPWHAVKLAHIRAEMFPEAMHLHEATILAEPRRFGENFRRVSELLGTGSTGLVAPIDIRRSVWMSLFFLTPVVSTTLASLPRLLNDFGQSQIDWLFIDESGQALPQSAAGAIWRAKRSIIVGDPLQVEPVVTSPKSLYKSLGKQYDVPNLWHPDKTSVQKLADRITPYGAHLPDPAGGKTWAGLPLRVHRRCQNPMFDIANQIAYDGQMVHAVAPHQGTTRLGAGGWIDIPRGTVLKEHALKEELDAMMDLIADLLPESEKDIYVISPFKSVARQAWMMLDKEGWLRKPKDEEDPVLDTNRRAAVQVGTIHTFQGKETGIVILVLGGDPNRPGARSWAAASPNMLNVAVTRAKQHLFVIGDREDWMRHNYFSALAASLPSLSLQP